MPENYRATPPFKREQPPPHHRPIDFVRKPLVETIPQRPILKIAKE